MVSLDWNGESVGKSGAIGLNAKPFCLVGSGLETKNRERRQKSEKIDNQPAAQSGIGIIKPPF